MVLGEFIFLMSFSALGVLLLRRLRSADLRDTVNYGVGSHSRHVMWFLHLVGRIGVLLLEPILVPVSALRFGSATQRKMICFEYALFFLACSILLRTFSLRALFLVWILPIVLTGIFSAVRDSIQQIPYALERY